MIRTVLWAILLLACGVVLAGCPSNSALDGSPAKDATFVAADGQGPVTGSAAASAQKIFAANAGGTPANADEYRIAPLDVLDIQVFGVADLNRTVQVSSSGVITMPLINAVQANGRTPVELEKDIARKLEAGYLQSPQVSVFVKEYNSQKITVDGEVKKPGIFPITGKTSLLQAIALAEGLTDLADSSGIMLFRTVGNRRMAARFDLKEIRGGKINDPALQAGDIVMVDQSAARSTFKDIKEVLPIGGMFRFLLI
jgi:polysaccharide export outer membrane protein